MTRNALFLRASAALTAAVAIAVLAGCTAQPGSAARAGATAAPAAVRQFACPTQEEVAALTAMPFTGSTSAGSICTYEAEGSTVTLRHPAGAASATLSALRYAEIGRGVRTTDAPRIAFDAFTSTTAHGCTVWFPAEDGVAASVTARRSGSGGAEACAPATAVATLAGGSSSSSSAPTVAVVASGTLLGTVTADQRWPWRIGAESGVRVARLTGSGYLAGASSFATVAAEVPTDSAAVVLVSGTAEAGTPSLTFLRSATRALSKAAARAPKAQLIVVGPVADGTSSPDEVAVLRTNLRAVANITGARYVDPPTLGGSTDSTLAGVADAVSTALRATKVTRR